VDAHSPLDRDASVTVREFLEEGRASLHMDVLAGGGGLRRHITEAAINRPGLALSGFFHYFAHRRIQVLGAAELSFLSSLEAAERGRRLRDFFAAKIPCVVVSRGRRVMPEMRRMAEEFRVPVLGSALITKRFINGATILMENLMAPHCTIQGTMVEILGIGVLIEGRTGVGKSETALALIRKGYALISDDITALRLDSGGFLIGSPPRATRYHLEIRGMGIVHVPSLFGVASVRAEKRLDMVATLCQPGAQGEDDRSGLTRQPRRILGLDVPRVFVPVAAGRDLANLVETAALNQKLRLLGHDAEKELDERLRTLMTKGGGIE